MRPGVDRAALGLWVIALLSGGCRCGAPVHEARIEPAPLIEGSRPTCVAEPAGAEIRWSLGHEAVGRGALWPDGVALPAGAVVTCRAAWGEEVVEVRSAVRASSTSAPPNILILLGDDIGADQLRAFAPDPAHTAPTPALDRLAEQGTAFHRAYAASYCSPTRAMLLTGRYPRRSGVGTGVHPGSGEPDLADAEVLLPEMLAASPTAWDSSAIGKWHLSSDLAAAVRAPLDQGFRWWAGTPGNLSDEIGEKEAPQGYFHWTKSVNGVVTRVDRYATTDEVDDAIARTQVMTEPWLMYVAFHAAHAPLHLPPRELLPPGAGPHTKPYDAMLMALDHEIGRLLGAMDPALRARTLVVFMGDNGTSAGGADGDKSRVKGSLYEGGIRVPLIIAGPGVTPGRANGLVDATDLWPTVAELAGVPLPLRRADGSAVETDGTSLVPYFQNPELPTLRRWVWAEQLGPSGCLPGACRTEHVALVGARFKLTVDVPAGTSTLVDLERDPEERHPLEPKEATPRGRMMREEMLAEVERWRARLSTDLQR